MKMSTDQEATNVSKRFVPRSAPVQLASKNPLAGQNTYYEKSHNTNRHGSAPLENKIFTNYCAVVDHDDLKNKGLHKSLGSLEKNYTRGVRQSETGSRENSILGGSNENGRKERPLSPTPSNGICHSVTTNAQAQSSRSTLKQGNDSASPKEWTKQRVRESNMEWRQGYEVISIMRFESVIILFCFKKLKSILKSR